MDPKLLNNAHTIYAYWSGLPFGPIFFINCVRKILDLAPISNGSRFAGKKRGKRAA